MNEQKTVTLKKVEPPKEKISCDHKIEILALVINFFTLAVFIISVWYQGCQTKESLRIANESNKLTREALQEAEISNRLTRLNIESANKSDSLNNLSTKKALQLTEQSNKISQTGIEVSNAPYLAIKVNSLQLGINVPISYKLEFTNVGLTPAFKFEHSAVLRICIKDEPYAPVDLPAQNHSVSDLSKDESIPIEETSSFELSELQYNSLESGIGQLRLTGVVEYEDIFAHKYRVRYNYFCNNTGGVLFVGSIGNSYERIK